MHGKRLVVRPDQTELSIPDSQGDGDLVYCPSAERSRDGLEIWELTWDTGFGESEVTPL